MTKLQGMQLSLWREQGHVDKAAWHESEGHFRSPGERKAFEAGFQQGFDLLLDMLRMHGFVKVEWHR